MAGNDDIDRAIRLALWGGFGALLVFTVWLQWFWGANSMDIDVYWEAGERMSAGGASLYAESEDPANAVGHYIYPPLFAALFAPLTWLPRGAGYALWGLAQLAMLAAGFRMARGAAGLERGSAPFYLLMGVSVFGAVWTNLQEGQVNLLLVMILAGGLWLMLKGRCVRGGLLFAVAAHLKVVPIVLLPLLIAQKRFKAAGAMAGGVVLLWLVPLVYTVPAFGLGQGIRTNVDISREYVETIVAPRLERQHASGLGGARAPNNSITAVTRRYFAPGHRLSLHTDRRSPLIGEAPEGVVKHAGLGIGALLGGLAMLLAWRTRRSAHGRMASIGLGLLAGGLANLLFWPHHLCLMLLVLAPLTASCAAERNMRPAFMCVGALLLLAYLPLLDRVPPFDWMAIAGTPTLAVLVVWLLTFIHFWRRPIASTPAASILPGHEEEKTRNPAA